MSTGTRDAPGPRAVRVAALAKIVLFNTYFVALAILAVLLVPFRQNMVHIRSDAFDMTADDVWRMRPNLHDAPYMHDTSPGHLDRYGTIRVSTNAEGFRDVDHPLVAPPGTFRIAIFGDSFVFGLGIPQEATISSQLSRALETPERSHYDVMNFGIPGMNMEGMGRMNQLFGTKYHPDVAVYSFICDDVSSTDTITSMGWLRWWDRHGGGVPGLSNVVRELVGLVKISRYTIDANLLQSIPPLYRQRIKIVLAFYRDLAVRNHHDVVIADYCGNSSFARAVDEFNRESGFTVHRVTIRDPDLSASGGHPSPSCNHEFAGLLAPVVRDLERARAPAH